MTAGTWTELVGAAVTLLAVVVAIYLPKRQRDLDLKDRADDREVTDYDETRRMLYVALLYAQLDKPLDEDRAGTIVNALVHHSGLRNVREAYGLAHRAAMGKTDIKDLHQLIDDLCMLIGDPVPNWG